MNTSVRKAEHDVFGVPTFIANGNAAFVRLMKRPNGDGKVATKTIELVMDSTCGTMQT